MTYCNPIESQLTIYTQIEWQEMFSAGRVGYDQDRVYLDGEEVATFNPSPEQAAEYGDDAVVVSR